MDNDLMIDRNERLTHDGTYDGVHDDDDNLPHEVFHEYEIDFKNYEFRMIHAVVAVLIIALISTGILFGLMIVLL